MVEFIYMLYNLTITFPCNIRLYSINRFVGEALLVLFPNFWQGYWHSELLQYKHCSSDSSKQYILQSLRVLITLNACHVIFCTLFYFMFRKFINTTWAREAMICLDQMLSACCISWHLIVTGQLINLD